MISLAIFETLKMRIFKAALINEYVTYTPLREEFASQGNLGVSASELFFEGRRAQAAVAQYAEIYTKIR